MFAEMLLIFAKVCAKNENNQMISAKMEMFIRFLHNNLRTSMNDRFSRKCSRKVNVTELCQILICFGIFVTKEKAFLTLVTPNIPRQIFFDRLTRLQRFESSSLWFIEHCRYCYPYVSILLHRKMSKEFLHLNGEVFKGA
jgi:hypothetical protein